MPRMTMISRTMILLAAKMMRMIAKRMPQIRMAMMQQMQVRQVEMQTWSNRTLKRSMRTHGKTTKSKTVAKSMRGMMNVTAAERTGVTGRTETAAAAGTGGHQGITAPAAMLMHAAAGAFSSKAIAPIKVMPVLLQLLPCKVCKWCSTSDAVA